MMDLVKKNLVSIISGVVALLAVGAIFWPVNGYFEDLRDRANRRAAVHGELTGLLNKPRSWPNVSLDESAEGKSLGVYPTKPIIEKGKELVDQVKNESGEMYRTAWEELNKREPLVPAALPAGTAGNKGQFVMQYRLAVEMNKPETRMNSPLVKILKAGFLPHPDEINARKAQERLDVFSRAAVNTSGILMNQAELEKEYELRAAAVPMKIRQEVAEKSMMYLNENSLDSYTPITTSPPGTLHDVTDIWLAQVGYWVQEDVCRSLAAVSEGATNVMDAPVKQLVKISVNTGAAYKPAGVGQPVAPSGKPDPAQKPPQNFLNSMTGRFACPLYDVVPFNLLIVVDGTRVQDVLQSLARNKFVTITNCSVEVNDVSLLESYGYYMGNKPLVKLTMVGEAMLFRQWTVPLMPPAIRRGLGLPETDQAQ